MEQRTMETMLEGILFTAGEPMEEARLCEAMDVTLEELRHAAQSLGDYYRYHQRGIRLVQLENSWQLVSAPEYVEEIRHAMERRKPPQLSAPLLEVLGIVAYFQPTTRGYIEKRSLSAVRISDQGHLDDLTALFRQRTHLTLDPLLLRLKGRP